MSAEHTQDDANPSVDDDDLQQELERTMAEAAAAVGGDGGGGDASVSESSDDPDPPAEPADAERIEALEAEVEALKDRWLRAVADLDNHKKRTKREVEDAVLRKTQDLLKGFLPTVDNLQRALMVAAPGATGGAEDQLAQIVTGLQMVRDEFLKALAHHGIEPVPSVGTPFDPNIHDALQQVDSPDFAPGLVTMEFEKGYRQGERLLRPARVIVAGPGSTGPARESEDEAGGE